MEKLPKGHMAHGKEFRPVKRMTRGTRGWKVLELFSNFKWARALAFFIDAQSFHHPAIVCLRTKTLEFTVHRWLSDWVRGISVSQSLSALLVCCAQV